MLFEDKAFVKCPLNPLCLEAQDYEVDRGLVYSCIDQTDEARTDHVINVYRARLEHCRTCPLADSEKTRGNYIGAYERAVEGFKKSKEEGKFCRSLPENFTASCPASGSLDFRLRELTEIGLGEIP